MHLQTTIKATIPSLWLAASLSVPAVPQTIRKACWDKQGQGFSTPTVLLQTITEAAEANKATLFFCKIGKDRTGVLAAMVLSCCGATRQEIINDYVK